MGYINSYRKNGQPDIIYDGAYKTMEEAEKAYSTFCNKVHGHTLKIRRLFRNYEAIKTPVAVKSLYVGNEDGKILYFYEIEEA